MALLLLLLTSSLVEAFCRTVVEFNSRSTGSLTFHQLPHHSSSGRPHYYSKDANLYLYHVLTLPVEDGIGRWVLNDVNGVADAAVAHVDSWDVSPCFLSTSHYSHKQWATSFLDGHWVRDPSAQLSCSDNTDEVIYVESFERPSISSFYMKIFEEEYDGPIFVKIQSGEDDEHMYLFKITEKKWLIGNAVGEDSAVVYCNDDAAAVDHFKPSHCYALLHDATANKNVWSRDYLDILLSPRSTNDPSIKNIYDLLRASRKLKPPSKTHAHHSLLSSTKHTLRQPHPPLDTHYTLRNGVPIPLVGFGTGGLRHGNESYESIKFAIQHDYQLLDSAREYQNEHVLRGVLLDTKQDHHTPARPELFVVTKVWPTQLGYKPTWTAIQTSLHQLHMSYIDTYLLHWVVCNDKIEWMHCQDTVDKTGTWWHSWHALERAYTEGYVQSIGFSNADSTFLHALVGKDGGGDAITVLPHVVQNFMSIDQLDTDVRIWCESHHVFYQGYASVRNMKYLATHYKTPLEVLAKKKKTTPHVLLLRYLLQVGKQADRHSRGGTVGVIPRSKTAANILANIGIFDAVGELSSEEMTMLSGKEVSGTPSTYPSSSRKTSWKEHDEF